MKKAGPKGPGCLFNGKRDYPPEKRFDKEERMRLIHRFGNGISASVVLSRVGVKHLIQLFVCQTLVSRWISISIIIGAIRIFLWKACIWLIRSFL